jgi:hypothetical protein
MSDKFKHYHIIAGEKDELVSSPIPTLQKAKRRLRNIREPRRVIGCNGNLDRDFCDVVYGIDEAMVLA